MLLDADVLAALAPGTVVCDLGTSGVAAARELTAGVESAGARFIDAPVSGSVPSVEAGTLLVMAGGDESAIEAACDVLMTFARRVVRVGDPGAGQAMKLAVNLVVHDLNSALAEALVLAEKAGITRESADDVLKDSVVGAPFVSYKRAAFLDENARSR
jgi:3-hydroxyisobutyrate dehydrogenase-like beta-hydroxyacid dehydrogenase